MQDHEDYSRRAKFRPPDIKMETELPGEALSMELELEAPKRKTYKNMKAKVVDFGKTPGQGGLFD